MLNFKGKISAKHCNSPEVDKKALQADLLGFRAFIIIVTTYTMNFNKKTLIIGSIILFIFLLILTNPDETAHRTKVKSKIYQETEYMSSDMSLGKALALPIFGGIVDNYVCRSNFLLFSLTEIQGKENKIVGIGILGTVFLFNDLKNLHDLKSDKKAVKEEKKDGKQLYEEKCSICHGNDGKLNLSGSKDITKLNYSETKLFKLIKKGKKSMPGYGTILSDEEIKEISKYVSSLN